VAREVGRTFFQQLKWTPEAVRRFWEYYGTNPEAEESFFSRRFGPRIIRIGLRGARVLGPVVDLGCGPGFLSGALLRQGFAVVAFDRAPGVLERVRARFAGEPRFLGVEDARLDELPLPDAEAGAVFLIEVLEHLPRDEWDPLVAEVARVLRPGGRFVITTPNQENLAARTIACPECGSVFHRGQHVESVDAESLRALLLRHRLVPLLVRATNFRHFPDRAAGRLLERVLRWFPILDPRPAPHLIAVAERPGS
jgi:SAM-dependent methyltransferase